MSNLYADEIERLLDAAVGRLGDRRRTFTEEEALRPLWDAGYELTPQDDPRFALAWEAHGSILRHWRLAHHVLANDRLLDLLTTGTWDGRDLDGQLARLSADDGRHYVFYPHDPRFITTDDGVLDLADREINVQLDPQIASALDQLADALLREWGETGGEPRTVRQVTEALARLGWPDAWGREAWLSVRAWLLQRQDIVRVGRDYWVPADLVPRGPARTRLAVLPVHDAPDDAGATGAHPALEEPRVEIEERPRSTPARRRGRQQQLARRVQWASPLLTIHINEGFVPVPAAAQALYPARAPTEGAQTVLRGLWHETNDRLWVWLDRDNHRLYGPALADNLAWCTTGDILRIIWDADTVVFRIEGHDTEVQREQRRLVDLEALAGLRGGLGESYRRSIQFILAEAPEGLPFAEIVNALRERQQHDVARNTVRAVLYAGGFLQRDSRWFAEPKGEEGRTRLRRALIEGLRASDEGAATALGGSLARLQTTARAISERLSQIVRALRREAPTGREGERQ